MFIHHFKYTLLTLLKNKMLIFWTFAFPIILGTFFYMAFSDIESSEHFQSLDIAVIDNEYFKNNMIFHDAIKTLSDTDNKEHVFNTKYVDENCAKELLESKKIVGYIKLNPTVRIVVRESGTRETILKQFKNKGMNQAKKIQKKL